jgi:hypothetical protein
VTVSDAGGSVTSTPASLTVTARAPDPKDLRFQLVDAPATVNGYGNVGVGLGSEVSGRMELTFLPSIGTPLFIGDSCVVPPTLDGVGCAWSFEQVPVAQPGLAIGYSGAFYDAFPADLQGGSLPAPGLAGLSPASASSVVNSLDLEAPSNLYALSFIEDEQQTGFDLKVVTVDPAGLAAAVAKEGEESRVVTAISYNSGQVTFLSYGWQGDTAQVYETQVSSASTSGASAAAAALAGQGYIITAFGTADANGDYLLVGTRVAGDTMARPFISAPRFDALWQQGYAPVAVIVDVTQTPDWFTVLGER